LLKAEGGDIMLIDYKGSSDMEAESTIDSQTLTPKDAAELFNLVDSANFFSLPSEIFGLRFGIHPKVERVYTLTIELAGEKHTVNTETGAIPSALEQLCNWLDEHLKNKN